MTTEQPRVRNDLGPLTVRTLSGSEPFHAQGFAFPVTVLDFWRWCASDLASNVWRGVVAEYLVAHALGLTAKPRTEWDACDFRMPSGEDVEAKSAAYLQSWSQKVPSSITFGIAPALGWKASTNTYAPAPCRTAAVYVFALLHHDKKATLDPPDVTQWTFFVLPTTVLEQHCALQKTLSLGRLRALGAVGVEYPGLAEAIQAAIANSSGSGQPHSQNRMAGEATDA